MLRATTARGKINLVEGHHHEGIRGENLNPGEEIEGRRPGMTKNGTSPWISTTKMGMWRRMLQLGLRIVGLWITLQPQWSQHIRKRSTSGGMVEEEVGRAAEEEGGGLPLGNRGPGGRLSVGGTTPKTTVTRTMRTIMKEGTRIEVAGLVAGRMTGCHAMKGMGLLNGNQKKAVDQEGAAARTQITADNTIDTATRKSLTRRMT
mmetsp:Transcript_5167/g.7158  ORF Transcript_5167/g.7158 Transcript_5167/m.7158 type:complete len:204 (-) Transcript_5167:1541-2152(-)